MPLIFAFIVGLIVFSVIMGVASMVLDLRGKKRRQGRPPGHFEVTWVKPDASTHRARARVVEFSEEHAALDCHLPIPPGASVYLENRPRRFSCAATVQSCRPEGRQYRVALQVLGMRMSAGRA